MLARIAGFEARLQLRSPLFFIGFALFFLLTFGSVTVDQIQIGAKGNVHVNSPYAILQTLAIMNVFAVFVVTAFVANVVIRDDETGFAPIIRATRVSKFDYLVGRFAGALAVAFLVMLSVPLGMLVGSWMPWIDPEKLGPFVAAHYLYAVFLFGLPTLLVTSAGFFALATATRSMMWTYVGVVAFLVLFLVTRVLLRDPAFDTVSALSDPFGVAALVKVTKYWTAYDRNASLPALTGLLLVNRSIWLGAGGVLFALAYRLFRFEARGRRAAAAGAVPPEAAPVARAAATQAVAAARGGPAWPQFAALTRFDMAFVFKSPAFFVLLAIGAFNALGGLFATVEDRGTEYLPVTRVMVQVLEGAYTFIPIIVAIYYAGELVWRDRERRIHEMVDATPAPDWAFALPKMLAISLVLLATVVVGVVTAALFQVFHGYFRLELGAYLWWFVVPSLIGAVLLAVLAVFVQVIVPHKFTGWAVMLVYVVAATTLATAGFEHHLYDYGGGPQVPLSDMNGMGRFWIGRAWFEAYWLAFGLMLAVGAHLLWRRGTEARLRVRFGRAKARLAGPAGRLLGAAALAWIGIGAFCWYNTNVLNEYRTKPDVERWTAEYEKALLGFENTPQPRIVDAKLAVELWPSQARARTAGSYVIENRTGAPLAQVHVRWERRLKLLALEVPGTRLEKEYPDFNYRIYAFDPPMQPGERRTLRFESLLEERGFPNDRPLTRIVENGTFLNNFEIAPMLGMSRQELLTERAKRRKHGLPAELRPPKLEDQAATAYQYVRHDSDWVDAEIKVTTDADQTPIAPGYTVSDTVSGGRRTLVTRTDAPILHFFSIQSARYAVRKDRWAGPDGKPVELAVYYNPAHEYNVQRMLDAMKVSLDVFSASFGPYQFRQARIIEFPAYETFAQSFANTVPYSEGIGFIQSFHEARSDETIDFVTFATAHEIAHQWWAHQVIGADKQGMTMLSESFAQYSALLVMEKLYGREQIRKFLKGELDRYLRNRGGEVVEELPLDRVENQPYIHYNKGALAMYWLKEVVGADAVNRALAGLIAQYGFKPAPYPSTTDFLQLLRAQAGAQNDALITDLFDRITLYDMKATEAKAKRLPDGRYEVRFMVEGRKLYADGKGRETEVPLDEPFDLGAFTDEPGKKGYRRDSVLTMERRAITTGRQEVTLVTDRLPKFVGVDPYNKRIDRNSDDNLTRVELE
jgi:aminopeptidase N